MDPVSIFSLACNVIQVVDFSIKVASTCRELYKNGTYLQQLHGDEKKLEELATSCSQTAAELVAVLQSLKVEGPHKRRQAITKTFKGFRESRKIESIQAKLKQYQEVLNTRILISLRQRHDLATIQQQKTFHDLDSNVQKIIISLTDGTKNFNDLSALIHAENTLTKELVSEGFEDQAKRILDMERCKAFLESLYFPEILSRQEEIADAHTQTFEWIFDESGSEVLPWNNFVEWLKQGEGIYWINGKAGSGKSTLMSYIAQQPRTTDYLKAWSETGTNMRELCAPNFFFWRAGGQMQKSTLGLLRSLVYQVVKKYPDLVSLLTDSDRCDPNQYPAWTERRLIATFQRALSYKQSSCCFCFFIDGLDEFIADPNALIDLFQGLASSSNTKLCVSSRPLRAFQKAFEFSPKLQLQDLTMSDIRKYIVDNLPASLQSLTAVETSFWISDITNEIIRKAGGVFLWVNLAVKDQIAGIDNNDTRGQLKERLERLPSEIEDLYAYMLDRIDKIHRKEAAVYLQIALNRPLESFFIAQAVSLLKLALMTFPKIDDILQRSPNLHISDVLRHFRWTRDRLSTTCVGLLEVHDFDKSGTHGYSESEERSSKASLRHSIIKKSPLEESEIRSYYDEYKDFVVGVGFIHQTTFDFFSESNKGKGFLKENTPTEFHYHRSLVKATLATLFVAAPTLVRAGESEIFPPLDRDRIVMSLMQAASADECTTGKTNAELLSLIDNTLTFVDQHYLRGPPQSHWCTRWNRGSEVLPFDRLISSGDAITRSKSASTSSSQGSFYSVDSDTRASLPSAITSRVPCDFLGLATYYNVSLYVQEQLASIGKQPDPDRATYLLACAFKGLEMWPSNWYGYPKFFALIGQLVEKGADPNTTTLGPTLWHRFLQSMLRVKLQTSLSDLSVQLEYWAESALKFLRSNANVHGEMNFSEWYMYNQSLLNRGPEYPITTSYQMSPLSVIQLCLKDVPGFAELQDLCVAKGGCSYLRCTSFNRNSSLSAFSIRKLSEQQSNEYLKVFRLFLDGETASDTMRIALSTKIAEIWEELDGELDEEGDIISNASSLSLVSDLLEEDPLDSSASIADFDTDSV